MQTVDEIYRGWLITPQLLAAERGPISFYRDHSPYLYLRETVAMVPDYGTEIDPFRWFGDCELIAIANYDPHLRGMVRPMRRVWFLKQAGTPDGYLDGITIPAVADIFGGTIVRLAKGETTIQATQFSTPGYSEREPTADDLAAASKHRQHALDIYAAAAATNERRKRIRQEWVAKQEAEARAKYAAYKLDVE